MTKRQMLGVGENKPVNSSGKMPSSSTVEPSESPNWLEMPDELMANIFQRLRTAEILNSAREVCTTWRRICRNPEIWKVIDLDIWIDDCKGSKRDYNFERLTKQAVDLSDGELIDIRIFGFGTDELLHHIVLRSSKLKILCIEDYNKITSRGLIRAIKRVPRLEDLQLTDIFMDVEDIEFIGRNCPNLKSFWLIQDHRKWDCNNCDDHAVAIAMNMPELRHLQIFQGELTDDGLEAIVNGCPHLESLWIRTRYKLDRNLKKLCKERIKDFSEHQARNYNVNVFFPGHEDRFIYDSD